MTKTLLNTKIKLRNFEIPDNSAYIATQKLYKLTAENFTERLK